MYKLNIVDNNIETISNTPPKFIFYVLFENVSVKVIREFSLPLEKYDKVLVDELITLFEEIKHSINIDIDNIMRLKNFNKFFTRQSYEYDKNYDITKITLPIDMVNRIVPLINYKVMFRDYNNMVFECYISKE